MEHITSAHSLSSSAKSLFDNGNLDGALELLRDALLIMANGGTVPDENYVHDDRPSSEYYLDAIQTLARCPCAREPTSAFPPDDQAMSTASVVHTCQTRLYVEFLDMEFDLAAKDLRGQTRRCVATLLFNIGLLNVKRGDFGTSKLVYEKMLAVLPETFDSPQDVRLHLITLNNLGHIMFHQNSFEEAITFFHKALEIGATLTELASIETEDSCRPLLPFVLTNHAITLLSIGEACEGMGMQDESMLVYIRILEIRKTFSCVADHNVNSTVVYSHVLYRMGILNYNNRMLHKALKALTLALALRKEALGNDHEEVSTLLHDVAVMQLETGDVAGSIKTFQECLATRRALCGIDGKEVAALLYRIGRLYQDTGDYEKALDCFVEVLCIETNTLGFDHLDTAITLTSIGQIYQQVGHLDRALEVFRQVLCLMRKILGDFNPYVNELQRTIGSILLEQGKYSEALAIFADARISDGDAFEIAVNTQANAFTVKDTLKMSWDPPYPCCAAAA